MDLMSLHDLGCFSDIQHEVHLGIQLPWPLVLCFVVLCFQGERRGRGRFIKWQQNILELSDHPLLTSPVLQSTFGISGHDPECLGS